MRNIAFPLRRTIQEVQRKYSSYAIYAYFSFMICARSKKARNVTRAENCDDLCLSVKGCLTRFCQNPMALRMPRTYTIWNIKVTSTYRLHCVCRSQRSERMNAKHCLSLAENDSGGLKETTVSMRFMLILLFHDLR